MKKKVLVREEPCREPQEWPWDDGAKRRFHLDPADVEQLEAGETVFVGETAYSLEVREENG